MKSRYIGLLLVVIFSLFFAARQFVSNSWLVGWDSLHPEFNYKIAFSRFLSGTWRESQGVGVTAIHSHMSDLPRIASMWILDIFLPSNLVRWAYMLAMLCLGVIGTYVLMVHILSRIRGGRGEIWISITSLVGALYYLFNLSTYHHFLVPFEMFIVLFGLLPWALWTGFRYLEKPSRLRLIPLVFVQIFISSSAYAATLWMVYWGFWLVVTWFWANGEKKIWLKMLVITLLVNLYWLLPTAYSLITAGRLVEMAKINQNFSPEAWLSNVAYGNVPSVMKLESFILNWFSFDFVSKQADLIAKPWLSQAYLVPALTMLIILFGLVGIGFLLTIFYAVRNKNSYRILSGFLIVGSILFSMLLSGTWPFGQLIMWIRDNLPVVGELMRTPFTKFSIFLQLTYALLITISLTFILRVLKKVEILKIFVSAVIIFAIIFPFRSWLMKGDLFGKVVVSEVPQEYLDLFAKSKDFNSNGRMVSMPIPSMWGWEYRDYQDQKKGNYEGANFTQFGILQPLLIRDFDRWSPYNEGFYDELSTALYQGNTEDEVKVLSKYDVQYVLLDESVIAPGQGKEILRNEETKKMANDLKWEVKFKEGFLTVWDTGISAGDKFVSSPTSYAQVSANTTKVRKDEIWNALGTYIETGDGASYPFSHLTSEELKNVSYTGDQVLIKAQAQPGVLTFPGFTSGDKVNINYKVISDGVNVKITWQPTYLVNAQIGPTLPETTITLDKAKDYLWLKVGESEPVFLEKGKEVSSNANLTVGGEIRMGIYDGQTERVDDIGIMWRAENVKECWKDPSTTNGYVSATNGDKAVLFEIQNAAGCLSIPLAKSTKDELIQTVISYRSKEGIRPQFCMDEEKPPYICTNTDVWSKTPSSEDFAWVSRMIEAKKGERYWLDVSAKPDNLEEAKGTLEYRVPFVARYDKQSEIAIPGESWKNLESIQHFEIADKAIDLTVNSQAESYDFAAIGRIRANNCDVLKRGNVSKDKDVYSARGSGVNCDYILMNDLIPGSAYLMRLTGENVTGRSVKLFLYNLESKRNDLEYLLGSGNFDQSFVVLPSSGKYTLNTETRSFGEFTENKLLPVELRYFPLNVLLQAKIGEPIMKENDLKISNVAKTGTWLYKVKVQGEGLIKLSQGYDRGWLAWDGHRLIQHVKVNGWANGWIVREGTENDESRIWILYWPQLLEYAGFAVLALTIFFVIKRGR